MALFFRQLRSGREFAQSHPVAGDMANFIYLIGDTELGECLVVDPAWDPRGLCEYAESQGMKIVGAICTHYHGDHLGGSIFGMNVLGLRELLQDVDGPAYCHEIELPWILRGTSAPADRFKTVVDGDVIKIGQVEIHVHFTPGHTSGGICLEFQGHLVTADTLFLSGCGRTDLPGGNAADLYQSLFGKIAKLDPDLEVYCGHAYSGPSAKLSEVLSANPIFRAQSQSAFVQMMGG